MLFNVHNDSQCYLEHMNVGVDRQRRLVSYDGIDPSDERGGHWLLRRYARDAGASGLPPSDTNFTWDI
jgi:hypothetical protein